MGSRCSLALAAVLFTGLLRAQIIEFESGGLKYRTLTRGGITIMWAHLPIHIRDYAVLQVSVSNGSPVSWQVKPQDFQFEKTEGEMNPALPAATVVGKLMQKASRGEVIKLTTAYEAALFGNAKMHSTNGYEVRRQNAHGQRKIASRGRGIGDCICRDQAATGSIDRRRDLLSERRKTAGSWEADRQHGGREF
jgi:hypothetical protein